MKDISTILREGANSFSKARQERPYIRRIRRGLGLAFVVTPRTRQKDRYIVRLAQEGRTALAECVNKYTGKPCLGFHHTGRCYHLATALIHIGALKGVS